MPEILCLHFYGVEVKISGPASPLFQLRQDFDFFIQKANGIPQIEILMRGLKEAPTKSGVAIFKTRMCQVFQSGIKSRFCIYEFNQKVEAVCHLQEENLGRKMTLYCDDPQLSYEIVYSFILSAAGEELDLRGLMRVHAAAVQYHQKNILLLARSGTGKSTLINEILTDQSFSVFSDEVALINIKSGEVQPFPVRMALKEPAENSASPRVFKRKLFDTKFLYKVPEEKIAAAGPVDRVFSYQKVNSGGIADLKFKNFLILAFDVLLGIGNQQMAEFMLRPNNLLRLARIFYYRIKLLRFLTGSGKISSFNRGSSVSEAVTLLKKCFEVPA
jgi:hypothetical protein